MKLTDVEPIANMWKDIAKQQKKKAEEKLSACVRAIRFMGDRNKSNEFMEEARFNMAVAEILSGYADDLMNAPAITERDIMQKMWFDVKDALPPEQEEVFVACADGETLIAFWQSHNSCGEEIEPYWMESRECIPLDDVTHWMWKPTPPTEKNKSMEDNT